MNRSHDSTIHFVRRIARAISIVLFLMFGAFFVEHLSWFFGSEGTPASNGPPAIVWLLQGVHLLMLIGFLVALKWEAAGSVLIVVSSLIFLSQTAGERFLPLFAITIVPALLFLTCWWKSRKQEPSLI
jgi:hypothetical protein